MSDDPNIQDLSNLKSKVLLSGTDATLVASSHSVRICLDAAELLAENGVKVEVIDLRIVSNLDVKQSVPVLKTGRVIAVDGGWGPCGVASEVIASLCETPTTAMKALPKRICLPFAPAPTSKALEQLYYPTSDLVVEQVMESMQA